MNEENNIEGVHYVGQEYIEDKRNVLFRFDIVISSPAMILPFEIFYNQNKIIGTHDRGHLSVSFNKLLPRTLVDDIAWNRKDSMRYVLGYLFVPLQCINKEILRQRYSTGHFMASTFSVFDILSIKLTNIEEDPTDEVISIPWPLVLPPPPHSNFSKAENYSNPHIFVKDYIDAWNDFFRGDYDNCIRKIITSIENSFSFYKLKGSDSDKKFLLFFKRKTTKFQKIVENLWPKSSFVGHKIVTKNLIVFYRIRNRITHDSLRLSQEDGWWICLKGLKTLNYFYQFLCGAGDNDIGGHVFRTYSFADVLFSQIRGKTIDDDIKTAEFIRSSINNLEELKIETDEDMNNWVFGNMLVTDQELKSLLKKS